MPEQHLQESDTPATEVVFCVKHGQVWIDEDGTSWYVKWIEGLHVHLERTVVEKRTLRDLVRKSRQPNEPS